MQFTASIIVALLWGRLIEAHNLRLGHEKAEVEEKSAPTIYDCMANPSCPEPVPPPYAPAPIATPTILSTPGGDMFAPTPIQFIASPGPIPDCGTPGSGITCPPLTNCEYEGPYECGIDRTGIPRYCARSNCRCQSCNTGGVGHTVFKPKALPKPSGFPCDDHSECEGFCVSNLCADSLPLGYSCDYSEECESEICVNYICGECEFDEDCEEDKWCFEDKEKLEGFYFCDDPE